MTSICSRPARASAAATESAPPDNAAPAADLHQALVALVRLLARQAVREWLKTVAESREEADCR